MTTDAVKTRAIVDWISVTVKNGRASVSDWTNEYELQKGGMLGYTVKVIYADGRIELTNPNRKDMGIHIIYSGQCLRDMEKRYGIDAESIVQFHYRNDAKFTRIDIAVDIVDGLTARECIKKYENGECKTKLRVADKVERINGAGATLNLGSRGGDRFVRIYDKSAKQKIDGVWTRVEGEFRAYGAAAVVKGMNTVKNAKNAIYAIMRGIVDYPLWDNWNIAMGGEKTVLDIGRKTTTNTEKWLMEKCAPAIAKFAFNHEGWLDSFAKYVSELIAEMDGKHGT